MDSSSLRESNRTRLFNLVLTNIAVLMVVVLFCVGYVQNVSEKSIAASLNSFTATVNSMEKTVYAYLRNQQLACDDWVHFLDESYTVEEAIAYLQAVNSNPNVIAQIVNRDTLQGYSTATCDLEIASVDYGAQLEHIDITNVMAQSGDYQIHVTNMYANPADGENVIAFVNNIRLLNENNAEQDYLVMRVLPVSVIRESLVLPTEFDQAELSVIKKDGGYIVRSKSLKGANFWEFLRLHNELDYEERDALAKEMIASKEAFLKKNANGEDCYFVCYSTQADDDCCYVGYLPASSIPSEHLDWEMLIYVIIGFIALFVIDSAFIFNVNRRLRQSVEETRKANMAKTQFLSSMSHDIRTPMNAIIGMTTIAAKHIENPHQVRDCLDKISLASNHLLTLVNDVLDISKVESGRMNLSPITFSLSDTISNITNIIRPQVKAKDLFFDIHTQDITHEELYADELRINQIFINILSNAVKYTPEGGKITVRIAQRPIHNDERRIELIFIVKDTGIGMSPEFQKNMYDTFSRAVDLRVDKIQGSGLGLAITKQMVDLMNGTIECESALGVGTTFTIRLRLPIAQKLPDDFLLPEMDILIVDDDPVFLETAKDMLESMRLRVDVAGSGTEALEMILRRHELGEHYPAVIIDWKMPDMDGVETTRKIRAAVGNDVPLILISSYDWSEIEDAANAAGANAFINKPLFKSAFYTKMNELFHFNEEKIEASNSENNSLAGIHLLVAEDNDLNWEIIEELLSFNEITADRAVNGEVCVNMLMRADASAYDAVLMDIQMPVMNGYKACRAIRAFNDAKKDIPIIAMTADAFAEDVKASIDTGMNGHVAKPIDMGKLFFEMKKAGLHKKKTN